MRRDEGRIYKVLFSVVKDYIKNRKPVSSRRILEITDLNWSSATIRNDLKRLEEMGYLQQPHTSAGRIPTDKGLRFYFEEMKKIREEFRREDMGIELSYGIPIGDLEMIIGAVSRILSKVGKGLSIVTKPSLEKLRIVRVIVAPIGEDHVGVSIITELGISRVVPMRKLDDEVLLAFERFLGMFAGKTMDEVMEALEKFRTSDERVEAVVKMTRAVMGVAVSEERIVYRGVYELMKSSNHGVEEVVKILEEGKRLEDFLKNVEKTRVFIGSENELEELKSFSMFVSPYFKGDEIVGHVALITDRFVEYERIYHLVDYTANRLSEYLTLASRR